MGHINGIDHVQVAMPVGAEELARSFYGDILGLTEIEKPAVLSGRGGAWFACGTSQIHLGADEDFEPAKKAHPALKVSDFNVFIAALGDLGISVNLEETVSGHLRATIHDPFGNRVELIAQ